jgi:hypothetical protein
MSRDHYQELISLSVPLIRVTTKMQRSKRATNKLINLTRIPNRRIKKLKKNWSEIK